MNNDLKRLWKEAEVAGICLQRLKKTTKNLSQDSRSPGRDLNPELLEYETGVLTNRLCELPSAVLHTIYIINATTRSCADLVLVQRTGQEE
jgi:hypothetical protein